MRGDLVRVKRGGHHENAQVGAQRTAHLKREGVAQVTGKGTLVEFVENDEPHAIQFGVAEKPLGEQPLRDDLEARAGRDLAFEAHLVADRLAHAFAALAGDELGARPCRETARLEHDDLLPGEPRLVEQGGRNARRLAAPRRSGEHDIAIPRQCAADFPYLFFYRKHGRRRLYQKRARQFCRAPFHR